jgi:hypothetical protein
MFDPDPTIPEVRKKLFKKVMPLKYVLKMYRIFTFLDYKIFY